jgi:hypothetical protein
VDPALVKTLPERPEGDPGFVPLATTMAELHSSFVIGTTWPHEAGTKNSRQRAGRQRSIGHLESND